MWRLLKSYNCPLYYIGQLHNPLLQALLEYAITAGFLVCSQFIKCSFSIYSAGGVIDFLHSQNHGQSQLCSTALPLGWWEMTSCAYAGTCLLNLSCHKILKIEAGCFLTCPKHILFIYVKNWSHDFDVLLSHNILASAKEALWDAQSCQGELSQQQHIPLHPALSSPLLSSIELWDLWFTRGSFLSCFQLVALPKSL